MSWAVPKWRYERPCRGNDSHASRYPTDGSTRDCRWTPLVLGLLFLPAVAVGQEVPARGYLASQPGWAAFGVVNGRLAVLEVPPRFEKQTSCTDVDGRICETICVKSAGESAAVHYDFVSPLERFTVEAVGNRRVEVHCVPLEGNSGEELHLVQSPSGNLALTIGAGAARRSFRRPISGG